MGPTESILYQPWDFSGKVAGDLHIVSRVTGYCWEQSIAAPRLDAYRCMQGNYIHDPCFGDPNGPSNQVVCSYPSPESVTVMQLTKPLPGGPYAPTTSLANPWLVTLADGTPCVSFTGLPLSASGLWLHYTCSNGDLLYGKINKTNQIWTIFNQHYGSSVMTLAQIAKAYY